MRPAFVTALRNPISRIGIALTTASALLFLALLAIDLLGFLENPYTGLVVFVMVPALFVLGLLLIPIGLFIERRRSTGGVAVPPWPRIDLNDANIRRTVFLLFASTVINV